MSYYKCRKCGYEKNLFRDMKNHININKSCIKDFSCMDLSNDEILIMTLMPFSNGVQNFDFQKIKNYSNTYKNKNILLELLFDIDKTKIKKCLYCNKDFSKIKELKYHIIMECFENEMCNKNINIQNLNINENNINEQNLNVNNIKVNNINEQNLNVNNINEQNINEQNINEQNINEQTINEQNLKLNINSGNTINNINNVNIILNINNTKPVPFDDNWSLSNLNNKDKSNIMLSKYMYSLLLTEILDNNDNLNVIIDKEKDFGIVYKNDLEKYIKMEIKQIISNSMEKLEQNLLIINNDLKNNGTYDEIYLSTKDKDIKNKYSVFKHNFKTSEIVNKCMTDIFDKKKDLSKKVMKEFLSQNEQVIENNNDSYLKY
jgi:hypothetical protein